jgi:hypothetical protein
MVSVVVATTWIEVVLANPIGPPPGPCGMLGIPVAEVTGRVVVGPTAAPPPPGLCGTPGTPVAEVAGRVEGPAVAPAPSLGA